MGDPLFTPALVGYLVSAFFTEVVDAAKSAYGHKKKCRILLDSVTKLQPHIDAACRNLADWDEAHARGLEEVRGLLDKARSFATKGLKEPKSESLKRGMTVWRWRKLPSELTDILCQIEQAKQNVIFVAALGNLAHMNARKTIDFVPQAIPSHIVGVNAPKATDFVPQAIPLHIVGVKEPFNRLKASILAGHAKDTACHLGLHGRGGAGKTLLAQMLHNDRDIIDKYGEHSILWISVGLDARVSDLYKTMATCLGDEGFENAYAHRRLEDQRAYLLNAFSKKRVLLILDDVWQEHCEENHEMIYWLNIATSPGSTTLLTTRNTSVLSKAHAESEVVLSLSEEDSWELFGCHAFKDGIRPSTVSEELAREVCNECKGLPLALKVIGSAMLDKVKEKEWRSALHDLKQSQPIVGSTVDHELFGRLRLSYDELKDDVLKTCFLYFAAFPEDYRIQIEKLFDIWISEGLFGAVDAEDAKNRAEAHLELLEKRSLIHWDRELKYVQVHDILRDLILWTIDKAEVGECAYECFFQSGKAFKSFPSGRALQTIKRMSFINSICEWPKNLEAPNLRVLLLSEIIDYDKPLGKLPSFEGLTSLRYLDLSSNTYLEELPQSIGDLKTLTTLDLHHCSSLKKLPRGIGNLRSLVILDISQCESLKVLPRAIGKLKSLTTLNLNLCVSLKKLPNIISELKSLTALGLPECESLVGLLESISELKNLTTLYLWGCTSLKELPESICELHSLTKLSLYKCKFLKELPVSIGELSRLTTLTLSWCETLVELPKSIGKLKSLTTLNLHHCKSLKELPESIGGLKCLTTLDLSHCESLKELPENITEIISLKIYR